MNQRQAVVFYIFMDDIGGIIHQHPSYISEKLKAIEASGAPEGLLDEFGLMKFNLYARRWKMKWEGARDYHDVPLGMFDEVTGEATEEGIAIAKQKEEARRKRR